MMILASQSPRRKELIRKLVDDFVVIPADIDENVKNVAPSDYQLCYQNLKLIQYLLLIQTIQF